MQTVLFIIQEVQCRALLVFEAAQPTAAVAVSWLQGWCQAAPLLGQKTEFRMGNNVLAPQWWLTVGVTASWSGIAHWKMNFQRVRLRSSYQSGEMAAVNKFVGPSNTEECTGLGKIIWLWEREGPALITKKIYISPYCCTPINTKFQWQIHNYNTHKITGDSFNEAPK